MDNCFQITFLQIGLHTPNSQKSMVVCHAHKIQTIAKKKDFAINQILYIFTQLKYNAIK